MHDNIALSLSSTCTVFKACFVHAMYKICLHSKDEFVYMRSFVEEYQFWNGMWQLCVQYMLKGVSPRPLCSVVFKEINHVVKLYGICGVCCLHLKTELGGPSFLV